MTNTHSEDIPAMVKQVELVRADSELMRITVNTSMAAVSVMGCIVNGPGESRQADIGISLPANGEEPVAPVFVDGVKAVTLRGDSFIDDFIAIVDDYVEARYSKR